MLAFLIFPFPYIVLLRLIRVLVVFTHRNHLTISVEYSRINMVLWLSL